MRELTFEERVEGVKKLHKIGIITDYDVDQKEEHVEVIIDTSLLAKKMKEIDRQKVVNQSTKIFDELKSQKQGESENMLKIYSTTVTYAKLITEQNNYPNDIIGPLSLMIQLAKEHHDSLSNNVAPVPIYQ